MAYAFVVCECARVCMYVYVRACVRAFVCVCVFVCVKIKNEELFFNAFLFENEFWRNNYKSRIQPLHIGLQKKLYKSVNMRVTYLTQGPFLLQ